MDCKFLLKNETESSSLIQITAFLSSSKNKSIICSHYFSGFCLFSPKDCPFAHGISDLIYENAGQRVKQDFIEPSYLKYQKRSYKVLFDFIEEKNKQYEKNVPNHSLDELNNYLSKRKEVRAAFHRELTLNFMDLLYKTYQNVFLSQSFILKEFTNINFPSKIDWVFTSSFYFIKNIALPPRMKNSFLAVFRFDSLSRNEQIKETIREILEERGSIKIEENKENYLKSSEFEKQPENNQRNGDEEISEISENKIFEQKQITEKHIYSEFYKRNVFDLPPLNIYLEKVANKKFEEFLKEIIEEKDKTNLVLVNEYSLKEKFKEKIDSLIHNFWRKYGREKGMIKLKEIFRFCRESTTHEEMFNYFSNIQTFFNFIKETLISKEIYICFLHTENFAFKIEDRLEPVKLDKVWSIDCNKEFFPKLKLFHENNGNPAEKSIEKKNDTTNWDSNRIVLIDEQNSFEYSKAALENFDAMGVDLEGRLSENPRIDLIQIGVKGLGGIRRIFIFDILMISKDKELYNNVVGYLKELLEDQKKVKIFHDCRRDSLALHFQFSICPSPVFDTSPIHLFYTQLKMVKKIKLNQELENKLLSIDSNKNGNENEKIKDKKKENLLILLKKQEELSPPGLNTILSEYGAKYGVNSFKNEMHERFGSNSAYFKRRPIESDFLEYSAKDVEDLVEVWEKMMEMIRNEGGEREWMEVISRSYVKEGCKIMKEKRF